LISSKSIPRDDSSVFALVQNEQGSVE